MKNDEQRIFRFGPFELDTGRRLLRSVETGEPISLTPRILETLVVLVEHAGELVEKRVLLETVWPNVIVEENNLTQSISALRRVLGERPGEQRYIATIPGRGYRFVAEVTLAEADAGRNRDSTVLTDEVTPVPAPRDARRHGPAVPKRPVLVRPALYTLVGAAVVGIAFLADRITPSTDPSPGSALASGFVRVSAGSGNHSQPALSSDGSRVVFVNDVSGVPQVYVQSLQLGDAVPITFDDVAKSAPSWSPDGRIVFTAHRENGAPTGVWWVDAQGTLPPGLLLENAANASYSTDGQTIVFDRGMEIWLADSDGSNQRPVPGVPPRQWAWEWTRPALSPDGELIAFYLQDTGIVGDIWVIPASGGSARSLTQERQHMGKPAWGPDGRYIYFASRRGGTWNLWRVPVDGGEPEAVTSGVGEDREPAVSRDGRLLVYTNTETATRFRLTDPQTGVTATLETDGHLSWHPNVSHDGTRFAYFAELAPREQVFVMNIDGSGRRQLTFGGPGEANIMPRWSSDDRSLYFYENLRAKALKTMPTEGGADSVVIPEFEWEENMWLEWSPQGDKIAYVRVRSDGEPPRVVIRDIARGEERLLDPEILSVPLWSDDGTEILGMGRRGVALCGIASLQCDVLHHGNDLGPRWSRDGSRIFFTKPLVGSPGMSQLWVMDRDGGNARYLGVDLGPRYGLDGPYQVAAGDRILWNEYRRSDSQLWQARLAPAN